MVEVELFLIFFDVLYEAPVVVNCSKTRLAGAPCTPYYCALIMFLTIDSKSLQEPAGSFKLNSAGGMPAFDFLAGGTMKIKFENHLYRGEAKQDNYWEPVIRM